MKRRDLVVRLEALGFHLLRHGARHDIYARGSDEEEPVPRHREIDDRLARAMLRKYERR